MTYHDLHDRHKLMNLLIERGIEFNVGSPTEEFKRLLNIKTVCEDCKISTTVKEQVEPVVEKEEDFVETEDVPVLGVPEIKKRGRPAVKK